MQAYQGLQGPLAQMLTGYMQNPFGNPFFQTQQQMGTRQAQNLGQTATSGLLKNMTSSGMFGGASSPAGLEMLQNQARANTGLQANLGFLQPVQNALGMQQFAGGLANSYRPLQTGQQTTQSTSGLGTWLPQVAGMGLSALMGMPGLGGGGSNIWSPSNTSGTLPINNTNPFAGTGGPTNMLGIGNGGWPGVPPATPTTSSGGGSFWGGNTP